MSIAQVVGPRSLARGFTSENAGYILRRLVGGYGPILSVLSPEPGTKSIRVQGSRSKMLPGHL